MTQEYSICETIGSEVTVTISGHKLYYCLHNVHVFRNKIQALYNHICQSLEIITLLITLSHTLQLSQLETPVSFNRKNTATWKEQYQGDEFAMILIRICIKTTIEPFCPHHFSMCDNNNTEVLLQTLKVLNASTFMRYGACTQFCDGGINDIAGIGLTLHSDKARYCSICNCIQKTVQAMNDMHSTCVVSYISSLIQRVQ